MTTPLVIVGAGGFGREVLDVGEAVNAQARVPVWGFLGFIDDGSPDTLGRGPVIGGIEALSDLDTHVLVAIGDPSTRAEIVTRLSHPAATVVHPSATIGRDCVLAPGTIVCAGVRITTNVRLGQHVHLNLNATVGHDAVIGSFSTAYPGVNISGSVTAGERVSLGTNASVLQGVRLGEEVTVGAGAVVVGDVPAGVTAKGVPARW